MKIKIKDLIGEKFGRLLILSAEKRKFKVKCDCGNEKIVFAQDVYLGKTTSCGCFLLEKITKHGLRKQDRDDLTKSMYSVYSSMKQRCLNQNAEGYEQYGGRGIKICQRWADSFEQFYKDMGKRPSLKHSIDRIDNDGDYSPENCRWATHDEQMQNTSKTIKVTFNGETKSLEYWCKKFGICSNTIRGRIKRGVFKTYEEAILAPIKPKIKGAKGRFLSQYKSPPPLTKSNPLQPQSNGARYESAHEISSSSSQGASEGKSF